MTRLPVTPRPRGPASPALVRDLRPRPPGPGPEGSPFPQASPRAPLPRGLPMRDSRPAYAPDSPGLPVLAPVPCTPSGHRPPAPPRGSPGPPVRPPSPDKPPGALAVPTPPPPGRPTATDVLRPLGQHGPPMRDPRPRNAPGQSPRASPPRPLLRRSPGETWGSPVRPPPARGPPPYGPSPGRPGAVRRLPRAAPQRPRAPAARCSPELRAPRFAGAPPIPGVHRAARRSPVPPVPGSGLPLGSPAPRDRPRRFPLVPVPRPPFTGSPLPGRGTGTFPRPPVLPVGMHPAVGGRDPALPDPGRVL